MYTDAREDENKDKKDEKAQGEVIHSVPIFLLSFLLSWIGVFKILSLNLFPVDTMDKWDQAKLESVVQSKADQQNKPTEIVCKHFIQAIEEERYGWFWDCPNGGLECKYRHALPPGFVLKKRETEEERKKRMQHEKDNEITLEDFLETEVGKWTSQLWSNDF